MLSYELEQRLRSALAAAAQGDGLRTPDRVEKALVAALRSRNRRLLAGRLALAAGVAAAVVASLLITRPIAPSPVASAPPSVAAPIGPTPAAAPPPPRTLAAQSTPKRMKRPASRPADAPPPPTVAQTDFIPVGPWQALEPMERGSIIRVRLPKSSLPGFGIPVSADRWNESIPADVVLAEDGSMRAVRFVSAVQ